MKIPTEVKWMELRSFHSSMVCVLSWCHAILMQPGVQWCFEVPTSRNLKNCSLMLRSWMNGRMSIGATFTLTSSSWPGLDGLTAQAAQVLRRNILHDHPTIQWSQGTWDLTSQRFTISTWSHFDPHNLHRLFLPKRCLADSAGKNKRHRCTSCAASASMPWIGREPQ